MHVNRRSPWVTVPVFVLYLLVSTLQMIAAGRSLQALLDWPAWVSWLIAYLIGYLPVVGSIAGACGAYYGWGWSVGVALCVFVVPGLALALLLWALRGRTSTPRNRVRSSASRNP